MVLLKVLLFLYSDKTIRNMIGTFKNVEECKNSLRHEGFKFSHMFDNRMVFTIETDVKIKYAEVYIYADNSSSALIGESNKMN